VSPIVVSLLYSFRLLVQSRASLRLEIIAHRVLTAYLTYYIQSRTHLALEKDAPSSRPVMPSSGGRLVVRPHVGGLHHRYDRAAA
jgi:hypothetical protein